VLHYDRAKRIGERTRPLGSQRSPDVDLAARVARLTAGQRACLDLVDDHATSKEIALQLGISRHTVDARLRQAMQTLGVTSRREAAIIWRAAAGAGDYQPFAYQPSRIAGLPPGGDEELARCVEEAGDERDGHGRQGGFGGSPGFVPPPPSDGAGWRQAEVHEAFAWDGAPLGDAAAPGGGRSAFPRLWGGANDLTAPQRVVGILIVMIGAMLAFGLLLSGIEALTLLRS
jgi:DNA-binding CsgD family transcriptional regulator